MLFGGNSDIGLGERMYKSKRGYPFYRVLCFRKRSCPHGGCRGGTHPSPFGFFVSGGGWKPNRDGFVPNSLLASVGGWGYSEAFEEIAKNPQSRRRFIEEILGWVEKYDLDGVDMDWEYPDGEQKGDFWQLITELRNALNLLEESEGREYLLSLAVPAFSSFPGEILMGEAVGDIDYWNLMTYDYHLGREGANAPLYDLQDECVARTVRAYEKTGIQKEALNLGIPLYGRGWDAQTGWIQASYDEIQKEYAGFQYTYHPITKTPYRLWGDNWISYDDEESVGAKARYARKKGLGGLMFWELSDDREKVLLNAARQAWQED